MGSGESNQGERTSGKEHTGNRRHRTKDSNGYKCGENREREAMDTLEAAALNTELAAVEVPCPACHSHVCVPTLLLMLIPVPL